MDHDQLQNKHGSRRKVFNWILFGFVAVAAVLLIADHRAHVFGVLPYLLLLACPLMHVFMHRGHHRHHHHGGNGPAEQRQRPEQKTGGEPR